MTAVEVGDLTRLEHSGLYSVQLQEPGQMQQAPKMLKAGARNSASDLGHLQAAHDSIIAAGAECVTEGAP